MGRTQILPSSANHDLDVRDDSGEKVARWMNKMPRHSWRQSAGGLSVDGVRGDLGRSLMPQDQGYFDQVCRQATFFASEGFYARS
jgi:hypothetical protein